MRKSECGSWKKDRRQIVEFGSRTRRRPIGLDYVAASIRKSEKEDRKVHHGEARKITESLTNIKVTVGLLIFSV